MASKYLIRPTVRLEFKLAYLWVGLFYKRNDHICYCRWDVWVCLLPCLPVHVYWETIKPDYRTEEASTHE